MTDGIAVEWNMKVYLNFWQVTVNQPIGMYASLFKTHEEVAV